MNYVDVYFIKKITDDIMNITKIPNINNIVKKLIKVNEISRRILIYKNMNLILENDRKFCESLENKENKIINNILINKINIKILNIEFFPFIDIYDDIIQQKITNYKYKNNKCEINIQIINELQINSNKDISFIRIENNNYKFDDEQISKFILFIQE